jgi:membrane protease YdiL (CAAX protease family)
MVNTSLGSAVDAIPEQTAAGNLFRGAPRYQPRTPWRPGWALAATAAITAAGVLAAVAFVGSASLPDGPWRLQPANAAQAAVLTLAVWQAVAIGLALLAASLFGGRVFDVLALRPPKHTWSVYFRAAVLMLGLQIAVSSIEWGLVRDDMFADLRPFVDMAAGKDWLLALLVVGAGAPLSEELLFRGFLLSALAKSRLGFAWGAVITSALWTALHAGYSLSGIIEVFIIGLFFSWLLFRSGSLLVPIFCHALYNSFIVIVLRHVPLPT